MKIYIFFFLRTNKLTKNKTLMQLIVACTIEEHVWPFELTMNQHELSTNYLKVLQNHHIPGSIHK